jgi:hypothetical protein
MTATADPGPLTARHATLDDLATMPAEQHARKIDIVAPPSTLRARLRLTIARPDFDANGGRITRNRYVKAVTYDTKLAAVINRDYRVGDFVEILADDVRAEKPWYSQPRNAWMSGGVTFAISKIRKADVLTPEDGQADPGAEVLAGVTVTASPQPAEPAAAPADDAAASNGRQARGSRRARSQETANAA